MNASSVPKSTGIIDRYIVEIFISQLAKLQSRRHLHPGIFIELAHCSLNLLQ